MKNKRRSLYLPLTVFLLALALAAAVYGVARYFAAVQAWRFDREIFFRTLWEVLPVLTAVAATGIFLSVYFGVTVARPVKKMRTLVRRLSERLEAHAEIPAMFGNGCVGALSEALSAEEEKLAALLEKTAAQTDARATEREQRLAALRICEAVAPETLSFGSLTFGVEACTAHIGEVGADFCDAFTLDQRCVFFAVGDVWERGLSAALFAARAVRQLRERIAEGKSPAEALSALNAEALERGDGIAATLFCGVFDSVSGELRYANAGHLPPVVAGETSGFLRMRAGTPVGLYPDAQFTDEVYGLRPGQGLVVYTDGVVSAYNGKEFFGYDRLLSVTAEYFGDSLKGESVSQGLVAAVKEFGGNGDDCAALTLSFPAGVQRLLAPELSDLEKMRELLGSWLQDDPRKKNIELACEEIFTNIVKHAGAKAIRINCERDENTLSIRFTDDGEPFNPLQTENGEKEFYSYAEGGMGMTIIRRIAGEIFYRTQQNRNVLTVRFPVIKGI